MHIAPGLRRRGLRARQGARPADASCPSTRSGHFYPEFGWLAGRATSRGGRRHHRRPRGRATCSSPPARSQHRFPECWRCHTPLIFRISDDWFISVADIREPMREANASVEWTPGVHGQADGRLARQHGRLEHLAAPLLRPAAAVLPVLVVRPPDRHRVAAGAGRAGHRLARRAAGAAPAVDRRHRRSRCAGVRPRGAAHPGGRRRVARRRHRPVLDARLGEPDVDRRRATATARRPA